MNHLAGVQYVSHLFQIRNLSVSSAQDTALLLSVLTSLYTECSVSSIGKNISSYFSDQSGRHASHHGEWFYVFCHHAACSDNRAFSYGHPGQDGGVGTDPHIFSQHNGSAVQDMSFFRIFVMVQRGHHHVM